MATLYSYNKQQFNADVSLNGTTTLNGTTLSGNIKMNTNKLDLNTDGNHYLQQKSNGVFTGPVLNGYVGGSLGQTSATVSGLDYSPTLTWYGNNVGIGTANPSAPLDVSGSIAIRNGGYNTTFGCDARYTSDAGYATFLNNDKTSGNLRINTTSPNSNVIVENGNVGIGTANPVQKLDIVGTSPEILLRPNNGSDAYWGIQAKTGNGGLNVGTTDGNGTITGNHLSILNGGNVGIGTTSPGAKLHVNGTIYGNNGSTNDVGLTLSSSGAGWGSGFRLENTTGRTWGAYSASSGNYHLTDVTNARTVMEVVKDTKNCYFYGEVNVNAGGSRNAVINDGIYYTKWGGGYYGQMYQNENTMTYVSYGDIGRYAKHEFWSGDFITNNSVRKNVSIGSVYPLEVHSYYNLTGFGGVSYMNDYIGRSASHFNDNISINANDGAVRALGFYAHSDKRIKKNIVDIDDGNALSILRQIQPKTYDYVDKVQRGNANVIGFIAQEIKEVLPKAVTIVKDYIPTFYTNCQVAPTDASNILLVTSPIDLSWNALHDPSGNAFVDAEGNACSDTSGNKVFNVKLYDQSNNNFECKTTSILDKRSFLMDVSGSKMVDASGNLLLTNNGAYFLHGQEVDDFHNIDKGAIFTVVTAAVQDIDRIQQADSEKINVLEGQITSLCPQVDSLTSEVASLTSEVASLTSEVASLTSEVASLTSQLSALQSQMAAVLSKLN